MRRSVKHLSKDPDGGGVRHREDSSRTKQSRTKQTRTKQTRTKFKRRASLFLTTIAVGVLLGGGLLLVEKAHGASVPEGSRIFERSARSTSQDSSVASSASSASPSPSHGYKTTVPSSYSVGKISYTFIDRSQTMTIDGEVEPLTLPTRVLYPEETVHGTLEPAKGPFPLIVFAPGYLQCRSAYAPLLDHWVAAGYVVAAIQFPLTSCHVPGKPEEWEVINQPADVAFVISSLVAESSSLSSEIASLIDPSEIGVAGHSDGGDTVAAIAANTCCRDRLVKAAVVMAGSELASYPGRYFSGKTPPMLFIQGSADEVNDPKDSLEMYEDDQGPKWYLDLLGAGHFVPFEGDDPPEPLVAAVSTEFFNLYLKGDTSAASQMYRLGNVAGVARLFSGTDTNSINGKPDRGED